MDQGSNEHVKFDEGRTNYASVAFIENDTTSSIARALGVSRDVATGVIMMVCLIIIAISIYIFIQTRPALPPTQEDIQVAEDALRVNR